MQHPQGSAPAAAVLAPHTLLHACSAYVIPTSSTPADSISRCTGSSNTTRALGSKVEAYSWLGQVCCSVLVVAYCITPKFSCLTAPGWFLQNHLAVAPTATAHHPLAQQTPISSSCSSCWLSLLLVSGQTYASFSCRKHAACPVILWSGILELQALTRVRFNDPLPNLGETNIASLAKNGVSQVYCNTSDATRSVAVCWSPTRYQLWLLSESEVHCPTPPARWDRSSHVLLLFLLQVLHLSSMAALPCRYRLSPVPLLPRALCWAHLQPIHSTS